ncbi:MAG: peroxiredoxin [Alphaproteobacteria bacterium]|nr:peroxiredoxin [Alphaproteobacteria bacterium]
MSNLTTVDWSTLPAPEDDGAADHLPGLAVPSRPLVATDGGAVDLAALAGRTVVYAYPMTGRPDAPLPEGWDMIPGARGCTPQSCAFRDHFAELRALGVAHLFGLSTQTSAYQAEAAARLHLPFPLLSDPDLALAEALRLPWFETAGMRLLKRLTLILRDGRIETVFYPVFPPDRNAQAVLDWLRDAAG